MDFSRHWLFIDDKVQRRLQEVTVLTAGVGIGSVFAELAIRTGIQRLIIADGDLVESHNLTRQNYTRADIGINKAVSLHARLSQINPDAEILVIPEYLDEHTLTKYIPMADFVINTIDFDCVHCITCSDLCRRFGKLEIFPFNLSFASMICMFDHSSPTWREIFEFSSPQELKVRILDFFVSSPSVAPYIRDTVRRYHEMGDAMPPYDPQLAIASYVTVAMAMSRIIACVSGENPSLFPYFYHQDTRAPAVTSAHQAPGAQPSHPRSHRTSTAKISSELAES